MGSSELSTRTVRFPGSVDGSELSGTLELPAGPVHAVAIFAHCFTCSKRSHAATRISRGLAQGGYAVLRFDFTGLGASEGEFADTNFTSNVADLVAAADWLASPEGVGRSVDVLVGHSLGGAAVIAAASMLEQVRAVAVLGAPASPGHVQHVITGWDDEEPSDGSSDSSTSEGVAPDPDPDSDPVQRVSIGGRPFGLRRSFLDDICAANTVERLAGLRRPILVLHSPIDEVVGIENAREIFDGARHPKSFVALDGADHLLNDPVDAAFAASIIAAWATRFAAEAPELAQEPEQGERSKPSSGLCATESIEDAVVVAEVSATDGFTHEAITPAHRFVVDEPASVGGADLGPNPYDLLLASLGACTSMTMRMYARRKGIDYGATTVTMTHQQAHARDCEECESTQGYVALLHREIRLDPALDETTRDALVAIADKCPVHKTLTHEIRVTTEVF